MSWTIKKVHIRVGAIFWKIVVIHFVCTTTIHVHDSDTDSRCVCQGDYMNVVALLCHRLHLLRSNRHNEKLPLSNNSLCETEGTFWVA